VAGGAAGGVGGVDAWRNHRRLIVNQEDELWRRARAAFEGHRNPPRDPDAQASLNRIAAKCLGISFDQTNCTIRETVLDVDALRRLTVSRTEAVPNRYEEPIVILAFKGVQYVIDGNRRVNAWLAQANPQPRRAIVIEPTEAGYTSWMLRPRS